MCNKRFSFFLAIVSMFASHTFGADWTAPENPDPQTILNEAQADAKAKRYDIALAKHVWFHENVLKINQAMTGVRLSFALSYWKNLANEYPPAMDKLFEIREDLAKKVAEGNDLGIGFHDFVAINKTLGEDSRTTEAFKIIESKNPEAAKKAFIFAKPALIRDKEYALYVRYVDPKMDFIQIKHMYEMNKQMATNPKFGSKFSEHGTKAFRNNTATLVAVLAKNDRKLEASEIATLAKKELDDVAFLDELESALAGTVPTPWP